MTGLGQGRMVRLAWPAGFLLAAAAALYPAMMIRPPMWDTCYYSYIGQRIAVGDTLYRDIWDNKLPVVYWIDALAAATGRQSLALYALQAISVAAAAWLLSRLARVVFSETCAGLVGLTYVTLACTTATVDFGNLTEHWAAPFVILCIYAMMRLAVSPPGQRRALLWAALSGFGMGAAVCLRTPAIMAGAALVALVPAVWRRGFLGSLLLWAAGFLVVPAAIVLWALAYGVLTPMIDSCILFTMKYAAQPPAWATWERLELEVKALVANTWVWHFLAAEGVLVLLFEWAGQANEPSMNGQPMLRPAANLGGVAIIWALAAFLSSLPGLRFYVHYYYLTLAPLALLSAWAWRGLLRQGRGSWRRVLIGASLSAIMLAFIGWHYLDAWKVSSREQEAARAVLDARDYLAAQGQPGETLYVFPWSAESRIMVDLGWKGPSRFVAGRGLVDGPMAQLLGSWLDDMQARPPDWLVCSANDDIVAGHIQAPGEWNRPEILAKALRLHESYKRIYIERVRFTSQGQNNQPAMLVVIYRKQ